MAENFQTKVKYNETKIGQFCAKLDAFENREK